MFLILVKGLNPGAVFMLKRNGVTTAGRGAECDIQILDPKVSRRHFQVEERDSSFYIKDLGSTNRTSLNKILAENEIKLKLGDTIETGDTVFLFTNQKEIPVKSVEDFNKMRINQTMRIDLPPA